MSYHAVRDGGASRRTIAKASGVDWDVRRAVGEAVDELVVERARAGDKDAWRALVGRYVGMVHAICRGYGMRGAASAEVNQVVWLRLVEQLPRIRTPGAISGWIAATTRAECLQPRRVPSRISWASTHIRGEEESFFAGFLRIGVRCQRLLRLLAARPTPSDEDISAALDVAADQVEPMCERCLDRFSRVLDADGQTLLSELERIVTYVDRVPAGWDRAADAAFGWLTIDAPVAERVYDSVTPKRLGPADTGIVSELRQVRFAAGAQSVDLTLDTKDGEVLLTGQLMPSRLAVVTVSWPDGAEMAATDDEGVFRLDGLPLAPLSVHVDGEGSFKTGWVVP
jgi:DNA-directed RNA polymerase specialized sigma24 family protein